MKTKVSRRKKLVIMPKIQEIILILHKISPKIKEEERKPTRPAIYQYDTKSDKGVAKKENYIPTFLMNVDANFLKQNFTKLTPTR